MRNVLALLVVGAMVSGVFADGPVSELYLTVLLGATSEYDVVQGENINRTWAAYDGDAALAVNQTVRGFGCNSGRSGGEFQLDGTLTGTIYTNNVSGSYFYDGTTDGTFNYTVDYLTGDVYRFTDAWEEPTVLFSLGSSLEYAGITHDPTNDSLWLANGETGKVENYTLDGNLLSDFDAVFPMLGLALDPADGTLWLSPFDFSGDLIQYSKGGEQLGQVNCSGLVGVAPLGAEFQYIPEPASFTLLILAGWLIRRR